MKQVKIVVSDESERFENRLNYILEKINTSKIKIKPMRSKYYPFVAMIIYDLDK